MRLVIARTLKKGAKVLVVATGRVIVLAHNPQYNPVEKTVTVTDCFDGRRYVHTQVRPFQKKPTRRAK